MSTSRKSITAVIAEKLQQQNAPSPFSFLKGMEPVNLDGIFPNAKKSYAYEISDEITAHMKEHNINYAQITTASKDGACMRPVINLQSFQTDNPALTDMNDHPDLSQHLGEVYYIVNPRVLSA